MLSCTVCIFYSFDIHSTKTIGFVNEFLNLLREPFDIIKKIRVINRRNEKIFYYDDSEVMKSDLIKVINIV